MRTQISAHFVTLLLASNSASAYFGKPTTENQTSRPCRT